MLYQAIRALRLECFGLLTFAGLLLIWGVLFPSESDYPTYAQSHPDSAKIVELFDYSNYAKVLKQVDDKGRVNYKNLKAHPESLQSCLENLAQVDSDTCQSWPKADQIAFWINAYNSLTLKAIIDHYPIEPTLTGKLLYPANSIRQIPGVWDKLKFTVMGRQLTLEQIEHKILREQFNRPEIHMALVCAARSCPPLRAEPFIGDKLDDQFADQTRRFLADPARFHIDREKEIVHLSSIFNWFGDDFVERYKPQKGFESHSKSKQSCLNFISQHLPEADAAWLKTQRYKINYLDYDWILNEQPLAPPK